VRQTYQLCSFSGVRGKNLPENPTTTMQSHANYTEKPTSLSSYKCVHLLSLIGTVVSPLWRPPGIAGSRIDALSPSLPLSRRRPSSLPGNLLGGQVQTAAAEPSGENPESTWDCMVVVGFSGRDFYPTRKRPKSAGLARAYYGHSARVSPDERFSGSLVPAKPLTWYD
jgi:hypothetical protein